MQEAGSGPGAAGEEPVGAWSSEETAKRVVSAGLGAAVERACREEQLDGASVLALAERDLRAGEFSRLRLGERKRFELWVRRLQRACPAGRAALGLHDPPDRPDTLLLDRDFLGTNLSRLGLGLALRRRTRPVAPGLAPTDSFTDRRLAEDLRASKLKPEIWKTAISLGYVFLVTWVTAVVMVIVHDKVPDMKKYPPLPDLFLDNVPHIPWAFDMCEITGSILLAIWVAVLVYHKHRFILLRRFFALAGTVFLLRCITMLITSLSVPGSHLKCAPRSYPVTDGFSDWGRRLAQAYDIWSGAGMSVRGVRTCGDYMFSGHTVALTLLNFFITEYTDRSLYLLHIVTWVMNMFGIFFILAAHEHYSIDVFIAFYITSRLFLYYHTLSNNQALMQGDSTRTRIWFPLLSFFESEVDGIVPNEYEGPLTSLNNLKLWFLHILKDAKECWLTKFAGTKLYEGAAIGEYSVVRFVGGIKRNLSIAEGLRSSPRRQATIDKDVQACLLEQLPDSEIQHRCIADLVADSVPEQYLVTALTDNKKSI